MRSAAKPMAMDGSLFSGAIISGSVSDVFSGNVTSRMRASESSMKPAPIIMVKRCFLRPPCSWRIWPIMPMANSAGESHERSKVRIWATMVVAMSAPIIKAIAAVSGIPCFFTKDSMRSVAAVELCKSVVVVKPEMADVKRLLVPREIHRRKEEP